MTPQAETADALLDELTEATRSLAGAAEAGPPERLQELAARRGDAAARLDEASRRRPLTPEQRRKLGEAIELGERALKAARIEREMARSEMAGLRSAQQVRQAFKPFRETSGRRFSVES